MCALLAAAPPACGPAPDELVVLAAASLAESFRELGAEFERSPDGRRVRFSFAGSQVLAAQLRAGAQADVVATANLEIMAALEREGLVHAPRAFASNHLVWIFPPGDAPRDRTELALRLLRPDFRVVLAASEVPAGRYARQALADAGMLASVQARLVSNELDVRGVLAKVQLGGADAGIAYATDARASAGELATLAFPRRACVAVRYAAAATRSDRQPELTRAFLAWLASARAAELLRAHGFGPA